VADVITEAVLSAFVSFIDAFVGLLPAVELPFVDTLSSFATSIGSQIGGLDSFIPITESLPYIQWSLTIYLPFVFVFYTVRWVYSMIPVFGR
jgi:hypothetical protein